MKVLVTGSLGYIGQILSKMLLEQNVDVIGCDASFFPPNCLSMSSPKHTLLQKDIRDIVEEDIAGCDAIIHLAALSNDPLGEINPQLTNEINYLATIKLAELSKNIGISRFIYSSSCSTYGVNSDIVDEESKLEPLTSYAKSKVDSELSLLAMKDKNFHPTILRNATAYGMSPSFRLDLVVNNLTGSAYTTNKVKLLSDGTSYRPIVHIADISSAMILTLMSDINKISGEIFNVGDNDENYMIKEIAETVSEIIPNSTLEYASTATKDKRSYHVNFDKIKQILGFTTKWDLKTGIQEICDVFDSINFSSTDFQDKKFYRVQSLKSLIDNNIINSNLKFV